jgi:hypothetical protein
MKVEQHKLDNIQWVKPQKDKRKKTNKVPFGDSEERSVHVIGAGNFITLVI